jgi:protein SCO1
MRRPALSGHKARAEASQRAMKRMSRRKFVALLGWVFATVAFVSPSAGQTFPPEGSSVSFALTAADGSAMTEQDYRGKWLVIYFGYTFCPDICPATLTDVGAALDALGPRSREVQVLFITIDPRRDTPSALAEYLKSFDPRLVGLTGTPAQIARAAKSFHVIYERRETENGNYSYDHSAFIYLVDPKGRFAKAIAGESGSRQIADTLSALLKTGH